MSRGHVAGTLQTGVQPLQAFPTGQTLNGYAEHVYEQPEGEPPVETNSIRAWRDWPGLRNGQTELRLNNQRAPRVHGLGWGFDPDAGVWRPLRVDSTGAVVTSGSGPTPLEPPMAQMSAWYRAGDIIQADGTSVFSWADRSGNGANLGPPPSGNLPEILNSVADFNNQTVVTFDGTQQLYRANPPGFVGGKSGFSIYYVAKPTSALSGPGRYVFNWGSPGPGKAVSTFFYFSGSNRCVFCTDAYTFPASPGYQTNDDAQIVSASLPPNGDFINTDLRINGSVPPSIVPGQSSQPDLNVPVQEARMGSAFGGSFFIGQIAEVIVYHKQHNTTERNQTLAYLSQRYAIPV